MMLKECEMETMIEGLCHTRYDGCRRKGGECVRQIETG